MWRKQPFEGRQSRRRVCWGKNDYTKPPWIPYELRVPSWEVDFCRHEGMKWNNLLQAKRFAHLFENILNWNDEEGEQAFRNAKARYWAKINGFESDIPIPNPDIYIDKVDQDEIFDPNMYDNLTDARGEFPCGNNAENFIKGEAENVIIWGDFLLAHQTACEDLDILPWGPTSEPVGEGWLEFRARLETENGTNREGKIIPTGCKDSETEQNGSNRDEKIILTGCGDAEMEQNGSNREVNIIPTGWGDAKIDQNGSYLEEKIIPTGWGDSEAKWSWTVNESNNDGKYDNDGYSWANETNYGNVMGNKLYDNHGRYGNWGGRNKKRWNGNWNWNFNNEKIWRKKENSSEDKSRLLCSHDNRSARYVERSNMQWRIVT